MSSGDTSQIEVWLRRLQAGDESARQHLIEHASCQLERLTRRMLRGWQRVHRWEETPDVLQNALVRLFLALSVARPANAAEFYRMAAASIRRELIDLARHYYGPRGEGAHHATPNWKTYGATAALDAFWEFGQADDQPDDLAIWAEIHAQVERLPADEREVFDLIWYQELSQGEAARLLGVSERTVKRRWASARLRLHKLLGELLPGHEADAPVEALDHTAE